MQISYGTQLGDYQVVGYLGAGGMGTVYRAEHVRLRHPAALKVMTVIDGHYAARFRNEARLLAQIRHPHVARFYDFFEDDGRACLAMEYVEGPTIREVLSRNGGRMPETDALRTARDVADALVNLHAQGILHRDLKSSNLKYTLEGRVKVLDFGIARLDGSTRLTATGQIVGTPQYLAPEQLRGVPPTTQTDLWALGVMLYEWTTGALPFDGDTTSLYHRILTADFVDPQVLNPDLSDPVRAIVYRCLKVRPSARPKSAGAILRAIEALLAAPAEGFRERRSRLRLPTEALWHGHRLVAASLAVTVAIGAAAWAFWPDAPASGSRTESVDVVGPVDLPEMNGTVAAPGAETAFVEVVIDVFGAPAEVYRNGRRVGRTPYGLRAPTDARVQLELRRDGYAPRRIQVQVPATATTFTETLTPLR